VTYCPFLELTEEGFGCLIHDTKPHECRIFACDTTKFPGLVRHPGLEQFDKKVRYALSIFQAILRGRPQGTRKDLGPPQDELLVRASGGKLEAAEKLLDLAEEELERLTETAPQLPEVRHAQSHAVD
jgi:hypothetical protein